MRTNTFVDGDTIQFYLPPSPSISQNNDETEDKRNDGEDRDWWV